MALISKDKRDWAHVDWPNPYNLSEKDLQSWLKLKRVPLEIITLMIKEAEKQRGESFGLEKIQRAGIDGSFEWRKTKEGHSFWKDIKKGNYQVFYDIYTPEKLRKRLEE